MRGPGLGFELTLIISGASFLRSGIHGRLENGRHQRDGRSKLAITTSLCNGWLTTNYFLSLLYNVWSRGTKTVSLTADAQTQTLAAIPTDKSVV
jgi:hypothetical protein